MFSLPPRKKVEPLKLEAIPKRAHDEGPPKAWKAQDLLEPKYNTSTIDRARSNPLKVVPAPQVKQVERVPWTKAVNPSNNAFPAIANAEHVPAAPINRENYAARKLFPTE
jgi:hypothetical protein